MANSGDSKPPIPMTGDKVWITESKNLPITNQNIPMPPIKAPVNTAPAQPPATTPHPKK